MNAEVSVIIPAHGRTKLLKRALNSVFRQTVPTEVIVIDDASNPPLETSLPGSFLKGVKLLRNEAPMNAAFSRNLGVEAAQGSVLAFLDSDDEWHNDHLEQALKGTDYTQPILYVTPFKSSESGDSIIRDPYDFVFGGGGDFRTSGIVVGKSVFERLGGFDAELDKHQDWDLVLRASNACDIRLGQASTVNIDVTAPGRMSSRPNLNASRRFFEKHEALMSIPQQRVFFAGILRSCVYATDFLALAESKRWAEAYLSPGDLDSVTRLCWHYPRIGMILLSGRQTLRFCKALVA